MIRILNHADGVRIIINKKGYIPQLSVVKSSYLLVCFENSNKLSNSYIT